MSDLSQNEQKRLALLLIDNLERNADLKRRLTSVVSDIPAAKAEGEQLFNAANALIEQQDDLEGDIKRLWEKMHEQHEPTWDLYDKKHRPRAASAIDTADLRSTLLLDAPRPQGRPAQLAEMHTFYERALSKPETIALLAEVNLTAVILQAGRQAVAEMEERERTILMTEAVKQDTTQRQDKALELLSAWRTNMYKRIEFVTEDAPQLREAVGIVVK